MRLFQFPLKISLLFSLVILLLGACSSSDSLSPSNKSLTVKDATPESNQSQTTESEAASGVTVKASDASNSSSSVTKKVSTAAQILARGKLVAGVKYDFKPFGYLDDNGEVIGFDVDIVREFARRWLGDENAVELVQVTSADRIPRLANGEVDLLAASLTHKRDRDELIDFSQTYFLDGQSLLVREDSGIKELSDLDGKTVAAIEGSTSIVSVQAEAEKLGLAIEIIPFQAYPQAVEALKATQVEALTTDSVALSSFAEDNPGLVVVGERFTQEPYGLGVPQGESEFLEFVNFTLQEMKADGTYDQIYQRWFPGDPPYNVEILPGEAPYQTLSDLPGQIAPLSSSKVDEINDKGKLVAGVKYDFKPLGYLDDNGEVVGFDVDIVREFARRWLGDENAVELVQVTSADRIPRLVNGEVDLVAASMTHKRDRDELIDFSQTYFLDGQSLLVRKDSGIKKLSDLDGKTVVAIEGSTSIDSIRNKADELGISIEVLPFQSYPQGVEALKAGQVDALTTDSVALSQFAQDNPDLEVVGGRFTHEPYGVGVPKNDFQFRELVNFTLQEMKRDGTYDRLYSKWFPTDPTYEVQVLPGDANYLLVSLSAENNRVDASISNNESRVAFTAQDSALSRVVHRGHIVAGVRYDFKPFGYLTKEGEATGFDVDLMRAIAEAWEVEVEFVQVTPTNSIRKLESGEVDVVAAAMSHTKEREETVDFSQTYFVDQQSILVKDESGIKSLQDLAGKTVAVIEGSTAIDQIQAYAAIQRINIDILPFQQYPPALDALELGQVDALTADSAALAEFAQDDTELTIIGGLFDQESYAFVLPRGDSYFNNLVNFTLQELKENGTYDQIYRNWFGENAVPFQLEIQPGDWPYTLATSPTTVDKPVLSKVDEILEQGKFVAGVKYDFKPLGFLNEEGDVVGFDIDLMREFAQRWLGDENAVELVQVTSANRIEKLAAGEVDIVAASMTHKRDRDEKIDFSQTYFLDGQSLLVRADSNIGGLEDLDGKTVAAIDGSTSIDNIQAKAAELGITIDVFPFQEYPPALDALLAGQVDVLTTDSVALSQFARDNPELSVVGGRFASEPYGFGLPNYDDRFQDLVNFTLQEMKLDGTYDRLYQKWFGDDLPYDVEIWSGESYLDVNLTPMMQIPAGEFIQGNDDGLRNEQPQRSVYLDEFYIDRYEVTNLQYSKCVKAARCTLPRFNRSVGFSSYFVESDFGSYPVVWISWDDANNYCEYVGKRLPTEAEWEKAARGQNGQLYPWGNQDPTPGLANFGSFQEDMVRVGSYLTGASPYGVYDMAGNALEWVADWHQYDYYSTAPKQNPMGPDSGITKVIRGGAWNEDELALRTTTRRDYLPESYDSNLGLRCASDTFPTTRSR